MIVTRLVGGLGNQMFQYAVGRHLAHRGRTRLKLDISAFSRYTLRRYELGIFNIVEDFFEDAGTGKAYAVYNEKEKFKFDPGVFDCEGDVYLSGSWQNERYFKDITDIIKREFTVKHPPGERNKEMLKKIVDSPSVGVHIRRGDYVNNPVTNEFHGICSPGYYLKGIAVMIQRVASPHFFVFSDDRQWAKANIKADAPVTVVTVNGPGKGYEDLRLMKHCKHFIIANSTFSWWAAWLSESSEKIVVAPKKWLNTDTLDASGFIPETWMAI